MTNSPTFMAENINKGEEIRKIPSEPQERMQDLGVGIIGGRIYDSENGKTCHQCRQKTRNFVVSCKKLKKDKPCAISFCHKCLLNRYGEKAAEVENLGDWVCPKCRGICNCSYCMKKKGFRPTGRLVQTAKATGFNSVLDLLHHKGSEVLEPRNLAIDLNASAECSLPNKRSATSKRCRDKECCCLELSKPYEDSIALPEGSLLTTVAGVELPAEDIGAAIQFLEFCSAFSKVLCIRKGQPEHLLGELTRERVGHQRVNSSLVRFHVKLLSILKEDMGKESPWVKDLEKCISGSQCTLDEVPKDFPIKDPFWYGDLEPSEKLKLVNFLCHEILCTEKLRNWIDEENAMFDRERRKNKEKLLDARRKEKYLKQQLKDEMAKSVLSIRGGAPLSLSEHNDLISKIRSEADEAHTNMLETVNLLPKNKQRSDAVRTEPVLLEGNGHAYWRLRSYKNSSNIILQDIGKWDLVTSQDKWFTYDEEQEKVIEKHVSSLRNYTATVHRPCEKSTSANDEGIEHYDANNSETPNCLTEAMEMGVQQVTDGWSKFRMLDQLVAA